MATLEEMLAKNGVPSRFERLMTPTNFLEDILATKTTTRGQDRRLATLEQKAKSRAISGTIAGDAQYEAEMLFAEVLQGTDKYTSITDGVIWTEPLIEIQAGDEYYVRVRISQHMVNPLLQGFAVRWIKPTGWTWVDGRGSTTYDEAISNPLAINRVATAPGPGSDKEGFRAIVVATYPRGLNAEGAAEGTITVTGGQPVTATGLVSSIPTEG